MPQQQGYTLLCEHCHNFSLICGSSLLFSHRPVSLTSLPTFLIKHVCTKTAVRSHEITGFTATIPCERSNSILDGAIAVISPIIEGRKGVILLSVYRDPRLSEPLGVLTALCSFRIFLTILILRKGRRFVVIIAELPTGFILLTLNKLGVIVNHHVLMAQSLLLVQL